LDISSCLEGESTPRPYGRLTRWPYSHHPFLYSQRPSPSIHSAHLSIHRGLYTKGTRAHTTPFSIHGAHPLASQRQPFYSHHPFVYPQSPSPRFTALSSLFTPPVSLFTAPIPSIHSALFSIHTTHHPCLHSQRPPP